MAIVRFASAIENYYGLIVVIWISITWRSCTTVIVVVFYYDA